LFQVFMDKSYGVFVRFRAPLRRHNRAGKFLDAIWRSGNNICMADVRTSSAARTTGTST
jgi:hypothetical protein